MNTTHTWSRRFVTVVVAALVAALGSCAGDDDDDGDVAAADDAPAMTSAEREPERLTLQLQSVPAGSMSFLYWARAEGLYRDAGIELEILPGQSSQGTVEAVSQGNADIGLASGVAVILGAAAGQDVRAVGQFYGASTFGLFVPGEEDEPSAMASALDGRSVLTIAGGPQNVLFDEFLGELGLDAARVSKTNVPITSLVQLYASGEGDGLITVVPFANTVVQQARPSASVLFRDVTGIEPPDAAIVVRPEMLEERGDLLRRFLEVSYEGFEMQRAEPESAVDALLEAEATLTREIALGQLQGQLPYVCPLDAAEPHGRSAPAQWEKTIEVFRAAGLVEDLAVGDVYTDEFFDSDDPVSAGSC